eukprot:89986_1
MTTALSQNTHLIQNTPKKYHTFQIVNGNKKHYSSRIFYTIASFFGHSPPLSPSSSKSTTLDSTSSRIEMLNRYNNFPAKTTFYLFYFNILLCSMSFTLIIPSLWSYLRELECTEFYLAYCISIYAIGELCGSYLAQNIKNKYNTKFVLILSMILGSAGGFIYGSAGLVQYYLAPYSVLIGRTMQGIWTGMEQCTEIKYLSDNVDLKKNANALNRISLISSIGFILGPVIGILLQLINNFNIGWMKISSNMLCGYFIMLICTIQIIVTSIIFDNKLRIKLPKRNTFTRTVSIQPRTHSTPRYTMNKKQRQILTFSDASPLSFSTKSIKSIKFSKMKWLDSASPPSTLPCIPDNFDDYKYYNDSGKGESISIDDNDNDNDNDDDKLKININYNHNDKLTTQLTATASYRSLSYISDTCIYHRSSVAEMLNIDTPSAYNTFNTFNTTSFTQTFNASSHSHSHLDSYYEVDEIDKNNITHNVVEYNSFAGIVMTFCFLIHFEAFSIQQCMTSYLIKRKFDWNVYFAHYLFIVCGIVWICSLYIINKLLTPRSINKLPHLFLVKVSLFLGVISTFCLISITLNNKYNECLYVFGFILISFTFPFGRASVLSLYCLSTNYKYINWIYLVSIISRILTPFIGVCLYFMIKGPSWMYGNITVLFMIAIILCSLTTFSIKKQKTHKKINQLHHGFSVININCVIHSLQ